MSIFSDFANSINDVVDAQNNRVQKTQKERNDPKVQQQAKIDEAVGKEAVRHAQRNVGATITGTQQQEDARHNNELEKIKKENTVKTSATSVPEPKQNTTQNTDTTKYASSESSDLTYGNNKFYLTTKYQYNNILESINFCGLLTEMPTISFKTKWEDSPAKELATKLNELINNEKINGIEYSVANGNTIQYQNLQGAYTQRMYNGAEPLTFSLSFRAYQNDPFNDKFTNYKDWISKLKQCTAPRSSSMMGFGNTIQNVFKSGEGAVNTICDAYSNFKTATGTSEEAQNKMKNLYDFCVGFMESQYKIEDPGQYVENFDSSSYYPLIMKTDLDYSKINNISFIKSVISQIDNDKKTEWDNLKINGGDQNLLEKGLTGFKAIVSGYDTNDIFGNDAVRPNNVMNIEGKIGASVWFLDIINGMFSKKFVVYINDWNVKLSRECNKGGSIYADFTINCKCDRQISKTDFEKIIE